MTTDLLQSLGQGFFSSPVLLGEASRQTGQMTFFNASSVNGTIFQAGNATAEITYIWPTAGPAGNNYLLGSSTTGTLSWINTPGTYGPIGSAYVTIGSDATLTSERALTGTANQIVVTDNGAGSTVVLSTPQNINTGASVTFLNVTASTQILAGAGTVSAPGLSFSGSGLADNGLYMTGSSPSEVLNCAVRGVQIWFSNSVSFAPSVDLIVTYANVGGAVTGEVQNTDNGNTASHSRLLVDVGGASAGDPYGTFLVTGATNWSIGIDNSDTDAFCITNASTLNGTNLFKITTVGQVQLGNGTGAVNVQINSSTGGAAQIGTLTNAPTAGNPNVWIKVNINGTDRQIPAW